MNCAEDARPHGMAPVPGTGPPEDLPAAVLSSRYCSGLESKFPLIKTVHISAKRENVNKKQEGDQIYRSQ